MTLNHTILIIPGLRDHVQEHWQTLLAKELAAQSIPCVTVPPLEQDKLSCQARLDAIDRALDGIAGPVIIVAHSAGCMMVAHWALGPQGHLNPASGHGPWPQAKQLIEDLQARIEARQPEPTA